MLVLVFGHLLVEPVSDYLLLSCRGFGFVTFTDPASVDNVCEKSEHILDNKKVIYCTLVTYFELKFGFIYDCRSLLLQTIRSADQKFCDHVKNTCDNC